MISSGVRQRRQFARLQEGQQRTCDDELHLGALHDLKHVEAHLAAIARPLLKQSNLPLTEPLGAALPRSRCASVILSPH